MHLSKVQQKTISWPKCYTQCYTHTVLQSYSAMEKLHSATPWFYTTVEKVPGLTPASATQKVHQARAPAPPEDRRVKTSQPVRWSGTCPDTDPRRFPSHRRSSFAPSAGPARQHAADFWSAGLRRLLAPGVPSTSQFSTDRRAERT